MASIVPMSFFTPDETINPNEYTFEIVDAAARGSLATIETSTTASKPYAVGEFLLLNGVLYRVTNAIAQDGTINPAAGGNVVETTVGEEIVTAESKLWEKDLTTWTDYVRAKSIRFGMQFETGANRLMLEAIFADEDVHRISWNSSKMFWSYYNHNTNAWSTLATWNNPNTIVTVPFSINTSGATGHAEVKVSGRVATISGVIRPSVTGTNLSLGWLQGGASGIYADYAPSDNVWLSCDMYDASGTRARSEAEMKSDAVLSVSTYIKDVDLKISGSWITKV